MNPTLLFCGIAASLQAEIQSRCKDVIPGVSLLFLNTLDEASRYLRMEAPFEDRDYPAPHFMFLYVVGSQFEEEKIEGLKRVDEFSKIPVILFVEVVEESRIKEAFEWLYAAILKVPSGHQEKVDLLVDSAQYWARITKLPLI